MMRRYLSAILALAPILTLAIAMSASAQEPDLRRVRPAVMLLVDTSGSMERLGSCVCTTRSCSECLATCGGIGVSGERNKWAITLEALNGTWDTFTCATEDRNTAAYVGQYDYTYYLPHNRLPLIVPQNNDGILDVYRDRVKFGLMTFDGAGTTTTGNPLVDAVTFQTPGFQNLSETEQGMYSYGADKLFNYPSCPTDYMVNLGARSEASPIGALVSVGDDWSAMPDDLVLINTTIQNQLANVRPYGATPIAAMLDDAQYYFNHETDVLPRSEDPDGDPYALCRSNYIVLLTDGHPDSDFRDDRFNCDEPGYTCPYDRADEIAAQLCQYDSTACTGKVDGVFVVGMDIGDTEAAAELNLIAEQGGTGEALFASNFAELKQRLSATLDQVSSDVTTRTAPAFAQSGSSALPVQFAFNSGFSVGSAGLPRSGVLERRRTTCNGLVPEQQPIEDSEGDRFHVVLTERDLATNPRQLLTVRPATPIEARGTLIGADAGGNHTVSELSVLSATDFAPYLGSSTLSDTRAEAIISWLHGDENSNATRQANRLGDIYHSSPVSVSKPENAISDESYNLFRERPEVANRPTMIYVGTNDGLIHAFVGEAHTYPSMPGFNYDSLGELPAGHELWAFAPPVLLHKLDAASTSHQLMADGTPVVRDVFFQRLPGANPDGDQYHTVLITGFRGGEAGYLALDVTDPVAPKFLWQFVVPGEMGNSIGRVGMGQALFELGGQLQERAIAVIPGGEGELDPVLAAANPSGCTMVTQPPVSDPLTASPRTRARCWTATKGRHLYVVDVATGDVIREFDENLFNSPLTGSVALYTGDTGTIATRGFVTDADGVIWRLDMSSVDPANWEVTPFHDIFWDMPGTYAQPASEPPVISTDNQGRIVVVQATGNVDQLTGTAENRVVSLREDITFSTSGSITNRVTTINWQQRLQNGEQVTGALELFDGRVYFATFTPNADPTNFCEYGESRIWGLHFADNDGTGDTSSPAGPVGVLVDPVTGTADAKYQDPLENQIFMGVGITQTLDCFEGAPETDPTWGTTKWVPTEVARGGFTLSTQVAGRGLPGSNGGQVTVRTVDLVSPAVTMRVGSVAGVDE